MNDNNNVPHLPKEALDLVFDGKADANDAKSTRDIVSAVFDGACKMTNSVPAPMDANVQNLYGCPTQPPVMTPRPGMVYWGDPNPSMPYGGNHPMYTIPQWTPPKPICGCLNGENPHIHITSAEFVVDQWRLGALYRIMSPKVRCKAFLIKKAFDKLTFSTVDENGVTKEIEITAEELCQDPIKPDISSRPIDFCSGTYIYPEYF